MKNNNQNRQYFRFLCFSICFGVGLQISFLGESQWSSKSLASVVSQPETIKNQLTIQQNNHSSFLSQVIQPLATTGRGSLEVSNLTDTDAYVKLVDPSVRTLVASFYVKAGSNFTLEGIPDGTYELLFVTGEGGNPTTGSFSGSKSFLKFDSPLGFITTEVSGGIEYSIHRVTLHGVANGNAKTNRIDEQEFEQY
jgi:hypothetical protein